MLGFLAGKMSSSTPTTIEVQEKQQFRDEDVRKLKLGEAITSVEENTSSICISVLPRVIK